MLRTRVLTALVALPAVLALVVLAPNLLFSVFIAAVAGLALTEIGGMTDAGASLSTAVVVTSGEIPALILLYQERGSWIVAASVVAGMLMLVVDVAIAGGNGGAERKPLAILGALYVGVLFPYFALMRNRFRGIQLLVWVLLVVIASDTGAYFVGSYLGRVKLAPRVSPHKTVEGAVGAFALSIVAGWILRGALLPHLSSRMVLIAAAATSIAAQLGDLACSAYKRVAGVKDSGWIFPGHGGLIDRASSLVFAVVFAYYYTQ